MNQKQEKKLASMRCKIHREMIRHQLHIEALMEEYQDFWTEITEAVTNASILKQEKSIQKKNTIESKTN